MSQPQPKQPHSTGNRRRLFILIGVAVVLVGIGVAAAIAHARSNKPGDRKVCGANLKAIGQACISYADSHQGNFPPSIEALTSSSSGASLNAAQLACPNAGKKGRGGKFVYVPGHRKTDDPKTVLAYEPLGNHKNKPGGHVLYVNGNVKWLNDKEHEAIVSQGKAHQATPPTSAGQ